ncbi:MAG: glutamate 5-kinase, partial [Planctomycetes bacterium]|nr:glutamate 5-kinase [Planctomycetota bacterium]
MEKSSILRAGYVSKARRIVVKVGTNVLTGPGQSLDESRVDTLSEQIACLTDQGREIALVSSGAIGAGMAELALPDRPRTLPELQATASVGQGRLVSRYELSLHKHGIHAGQILLTRDDFDSRSRYLNASNTIHALFDAGCLPVINENDTISTDEIRFGDNDLLAAFVTHMIRAELLVLLTSVPGLCAHEPYPDAVRSVHDNLSGDHGNVLDVVETVDEDLQKLALDETSPGGTGGMQTKLEAARIATEAGEAALIADGQADNILLDLMNGKRLGTLFLPADERLASRKRWIRFSRRPKGDIFVDEGARAALEERGKSLLPSGITTVKGDFSSGDVVRIKGPDGEEFARGLTNYTAEEVDSIKGLKTSRIEPTLGHK